MGALTARCAAYNPTCRARFDWFVTPLPDGSAAGKNN